MTKRYKLSKKHRQALLVGLGHAGVHGDAAKDCIRRLATIAQRGYRRINARLPDVAISRVDAARVRWQLACVLWEELEEYDEHFGNLLERSVGEEVGAVKNRKREGKNALKYAVEKLELISSAADKCQDRALEQLWNSKKKQDRAVRKLGRDVAREWQETTHRELPWPTERITGSSNELEVNFTGVQPLRVLLDSIGIHFVSGSGVGALMDCVSGKELREVQSGI